MAEKIAQVHDRVGDEIGSNPYGGLQNTFEIKISELLYVQLMNWRDRKVLWRKAVDADT